MFELPPREWITEHLAAARWFPGTGEEFTVDRVDPLAWWTEVGDPLPVVTLLVTISRSDGRSEIYQVFATRNDAGEWRDGTGDPGALAVLWRTFLSSKGLDHLRFRVDVPGIAHDLPPRRFAGEQSNTSVRFGDVAMAKFFRRLENGSNPDIQVHRLLAGQPHVATLIGSMDAQWGAASGQHHADLMMVTELLTGASDGWDLAVEAASGSKPFTEQAAALGTALAGVHTALAERGPTGTLSSAALRDQFGQRLADAVTVVPELAEHQAALQDLYNQVTGASLSSQLVHGDFHLGQTVFCDPERDGDGSWRILDFEGEPLKSLSERTALDCPVRDVAGMLRSLDYAAGHASDPAWGRAAREAFLVAYRDDTDPVLLRAYEADKAVYEAVYEKRHRPDWLTIPLGAVARLTTASGTH